MPKTSSLDAARRGGDFYPIVPILLYVLVGVGIGMMINACWNTGVVNALICIVGGYLLKQARVTFCSRSAKSRRRQRRHGAAFAGLVGLVGKDPDVARGLLIDTGAAVNVHSEAWIKSYIKSCLQPLRLWLTTLQQGTSITGVEGKPLGTSRAHRVPGGLLGRAADGSSREVPATFTSQELKGSCPALLSNYSLIEGEAIMNFKMRTLELLVNGERILFDLVLTRSGHFILPLDGFGKDLKKYEEGQEQIVFFQNNELIQADSVLFNGSLEDVYDGEWKDVNKDFLQAVAVDEVYTNFDTTAATQGSAVPDDLDEPIFKDDDSLCGGEPRVTKRDLLNARVDVSEMQVFLVLEEGTRRLLKEANHLEAPGLSREPGVLWNHVRARTSIDLDNGDVLEDRLRIYPDHTPEVLLTKETRLLTALFYDYEKVEKPEYEGPPEDNEGVVLSVPEWKSMVDSNVIRLRESNFHYWGSNGEKIAWIEPGTEPPLTDDADSSSWDLWTWLIPSGKYGSSAESFHLRSGWAADETSGWNFSDEVHQEKLAEQRRLHKPKLLLVSLDSKTRNFPRKVSTSTKAWLNELEAKTLQFVVRECEKQLLDGNDYLITLKAGSEKWREPALQALEGRSDGEEAVFSDMCEFFLKDPENQLPYKQRIGILSSFPLDLAEAQCSGHHGKAHQWTAGCLSKRFGNLPRVARASEPTTCFCKAVLKDFVASRNPFTRAAGCASRVTERPAGQNQSDHHDSETTVFATYQGEKLTCLRCRKMARGQTTTKQHTRQHGCRERGKKHHMHGVQEERRAALQRGSSSSSKAAVRRLPRLPAAKMKPKAKAVADRGAVSSKRPVGAARSLLDDEEDDLLTDGEDDTPEGVPAMGAKYRQESAEPSAQAARARIGEKADDLDLANRIIRWCDTLQAGQTRFVDFSAEFGEAAMRGPEDMQRDIDNRWCEKNEFELVYAQIARLPVGRREAGPHADPKLCPWRKTIILTAEGEVRIEGWEKVYGSGAKLQPSERFRRLNVDWTITLFARQRPAKTKEQGGKIVDELDEIPEEKWEIPLILPNMGRLTKFLLSPNEKTRMKGLRLFHQRHWHASVQSMQKYLDRAGLEIPEKELRAVIKACKACRMWEMPKSTPKDRTGGPERVNQQVEFDFLFYKDQPIGHIICRYIRYSPLTVVPNREVESCIHCLLDWFRFFAHMEELHVDGEGAMTSDEFGLWCQRKGIKRVLAGKDQHLKIVERHNGLIRRIMRLLDAEAQLAGITLSITEIAYEAAAGKNSTVEYGGFTSLQALGTNSLSSIDRGEPQGNDNLGVFGDGYRKRMIALRAVQMAIYEERAARSMRGKGPTVTKEDFQPGVKVDVWSKPNKKDDSGWRGPCTVLDETEGTVDYKWQSVIRRTDVTKCRLSDFFVGFYHQFYAKDAGAGGMLEADVLIVLVRHAESLAFGSSEVHGTVVIQNQEVVTEPARGNQMELMKAARELALDWQGLAFCAGCVLFHGVRKTPPISKAGSSVALIWRMQHVKSMVMSSIDGSKVHDVNRLIGDNDWQNCAGIILYTFHSMEQPCYDSKEMQAIVDEDDWHSTHPYGDPESVPVPESPVVSEAEDSDPTPEAVTPDTGSPAAPASPLATHQQPGTSSSSNQHGSSWLQSAAVAAARIGADAVASQAGSALGGAIAGPAGELLGGQAGSAIATGVAQAIESSRPDAVLEPPQAVQIDGEWYLPGLPDPVSEEEAHDPGALEVDLENVTCSALHVEQKLEVRDPRQKDSLASLVFEPEVQVPVWSNECRERVEYKQTLAKISELTDPAHTLLTKADDDDDRMVFYTCMRTGDVFRVEKVGSDLTAAELIQFAAKVRDAKLSELRNWHSHEAFKPVRTSTAIMCGRPMKSRWVIKWKIIGGKKEVRARLCIKGFMDPQLNQLVTAAATASALSHRVLCSEATNRGWPVVSFDISSAFLQGKSFKKLESEAKEQKRIVHFDPPEDAYLLLLEIDEKHFEIFTQVYSAAEVTLESLKGGFGLGDAPRLWREEFDEWMMQEVRFAKSRYDECFYLRKQFPGAGMSQLLADMHVDDVEATGEWPNLMWFKEKLEKRFGKVKMEFGDFKHTGVMYHQLKNFKEIVHEQIEFVLAMSYFGVNKERKKQKGSPCTPEEHKGFRSIIGGLRWVTRTRADLSAELGDLQTHAHSPLIEHLVAANSLLRRAKDTAKDNVLRYKQQPAGPKRLVIDADSSFNNRVDAKSRSTSGWTVMLMPDVEESLDTDVGHVLNFVSRRFNRVTKGTLSAEGIAHATALEDAVRIAGWLHEISQPLESTMSMIVAQETGFVIPIDVCTDARSLYDVITSSMEPHPTDSSAILWLRWIREVYQRGMARRIVWKGTMDMLADGLTKSGIDILSLTRALADGSYRSQYAQVSGGGIIDAWKGLPPSKKDRSGKPAEAEAWYQAVLLSVITWQQGLREEQ